MFKIYTNGAETFFLSSENTLCCGLSKLHFTFKFLIAINNLYISKCRVNIL